MLDRLKTALGDRYVLERELGEGGMATVYLARDVKHERPVAIKVLTSGRTTTSGSRTTTSGSLDGPPPGAYSVRGD